MDADKPETGVLGCYTVRMPGKADRTFIEGAEAVRYLTENKGYAKLFDREGKLMLVKGEPKPDG